MNAGQPNERTGNSDGAGTRGLLAGVRVLDLTRVLAGPYATSLLADMGADVVKIENPAEPDSSRATPPMVGGVSNHFMNLNRNKRSLALDLATDEGLEVMLGLVAHADVVVENFRPGVMERLGLSYDKLRAVNDQIILCSISGFGQTGRYRQKPAYDVIIQAMSGAMSVTGEEGGTPVRMGVPMGDLSGGLFGAIGILAALHDRTVTGTGQWVDVSMLDGLTHLMLYYPIDFLNAGLIAGPVGGRHKHIAPYGVLPVKDGHLVLAIFVKKFWNIFCEAIGHPELIADERFRRASDRLANSAELYPLLEDVLRTRTQAEWSETFDEVGLPFSPVQTVDEVAQSEVLRERDMFIQTTHPQAGQVWVMGRPVKFPHRAPFTVAAAPALGQHSEEILEGTLGLDDVTLQELRAKHVI